MPESACSAITFSAQRKVILRHPHVRRLTVLDGYKLTTLPAPEMGTSRVYEGPTGQLWTVAPEGLQVFRDGEWRVFSVPEIATQMRLATNRPADPVPMCLAQENEVVFLVPGALMRLSFEQPAFPRIQVLRRADQEQLGAFSGLTQARDGGLWITTARGLAKVPGPLRDLQPETPWTEYRVPEAAGISDLEQPFEDEDGNITVLGQATDAKGRRVARFDGQQWKTENSDALKLRVAWRSRDKTCWGAASDSLWQWQEARPKFAEIEEISAREYFDVALEPGGTFWLATSEGLFRYSPPLWRKPPALGALSAPVNALAEDASGTIWFATGNVLYELREESLQSFIVLTNKGPNDGLRAICPLKQGELLLDAGGRLLAFTPAGARLRVLPGGERPGERRILGPLRDGSVCVQHFLPGAPAAGHVFEKFDGNRFEPLTESAGGPGLEGEITAVLAVQNGDLWVGGQNGTAWLRERKWQVFRPGERLSPQRVTGLIEVADGRVWCSTPDQILEFDGRNWSVVRGGFEHINALLRGRDGAVWVGSNNGTDRYAGSAWVENGPEEGLLSANVTALLETRQGVFAATSRGLCHFDAKADLDAPMTSVYRLNEEQGGPLESSGIAVGFTALDKWKYTPRERLLFSYRWDERDWSPFIERNSLPLPELAAGRHFFHVRAMDRSGNVDSHPARLEFSIVLPWYKETRLVLISIAGIAGVLFFAGVAINRHWQLVRSYAEVEKKVAQRTAELELANQELLQSEKMKALGTLAAGIAHDFNNILSIVKGSAQLIEENLDHADKVRLRVDRIKTVVEQGTGIVQAMLGFSRDSDQQPELCDVNAVVEETLKLLGDRFLREVQVAFEGGAGLPPVLVSKGLVQQILLNFIFNAAEALPKGGRIVLSTRRLEKPPPGLVLLPGHADGYVAVAVRDFGCGIPPENLTRIFEPFFTTKAFSTRRGTGLGLSMAYELAKKMEAGLAVVSALSQGSTFELILPMRISAAMPKPPEAEPALTPASTPRQP